MLHWEIVSGSKQHNAIRKMRNRFKTAPPLKKKQKKKPSQKKNKKQTTKCLFSSFSRYSFFEKQLVFSVRFYFFSLQNKKKSLGLQVHRLICPSDSPNSCQSQSRTWAKQSFSAKMSLHCENQTQRPEKTLHWLSLYSLTSPSLYSSRHFCFCHNLNASDWSSNRKD